MNDRTSMNEVPRDQAGKDPSPAPTTWDGNPITTEHLCLLTKQSRQTIWRDVRAGLLPRLERQPGVRWFVYPPAAVKRYLKLKYPHLLPSAV